MARFAQLLFFAVLLTYLKGLQPHQLPQADEIADALNASTAIGTTPSRVMIATALLSTRCETSLATYFLLLSLKNKADYVSLHNYGLYWALEEMDPRLKGPWNKVAVLLYLLEALDTQQFEWILWVDYDTLMNMHVEVPLDSLSDQHHLLLSGGASVFTEADALGLNTGVFLLRISDWSKQFLSQLAAIGYNYWDNPESDARKLVEATVKNYDYYLNDQAGTAYVLHKHQEWRAHVALQWEEARGDWLLQRLVMFEGEEGGRGVVAEHYAGCQLCSPSASHLSSSEQKKCTRDFAERFGRQDVVARQHMGGRALDVDALMNSTKAGRGRHGHRHTHNQ